MQQNAHSYFLDKLSQIGPMFIWTFPLKMISWAHSYAMDILLPGTVYRPVLGCGIHNAQILSCLCEYLAGFFITLFMPFG
jgi:hypothetical protein